MKKMNLRFLLASLTLAATGPVAHAEILDDWQFDESAGTSLLNTVNSGTGGGGFASSWDDGDIGDSSTTGDGTFRIQRVIGNSHTAYATIWYDIPDVMWMVADLEGWNFSTNEGGRNEDMRFGFSHTTVGNQYAEIWIGRRASAGEVFIQGVGELRSGGAEWIPPVPTGLSNEEDRHVQVVLKVDQTNQEYSVYYNIEDAGYVHLGTGPLHQDRQPNFIRFRGLNSFADEMDPDDPNSPVEFADVGRIYVTTEDPIGEDIIPAPEPGLPEETITQDWQFDDEAGATLSQTTNSAGDAQWIPYSLDPADDIGNSFTTGDGTFRIQRAIGGGTTNLVSLDREWTGTQWLVVDFAGWNLTGSQNEIIDLGFIDNYTVSERNKAAVRLRRWEMTDNPDDYVGPENPDAERVYLSGRVYGEANGAQVIDDQPIFDAEQTESVRIVIELDEVDKTYAIYYRIGNGDYVLVDEAATDPNLGPNGLRFYAINSFDDQDEFVDVDRVFLTGANPMVEDVSEGFAGWAGNNFPDGGTDAEAGADPDGDGVSNLLEYGFGGNPTVADRSVVPSTMIGQNQIAEDYLQVQFTRNPDATDLTYTVLGSSDLVGWTPIASAANGEAFVASGASNIEVDGDTVTVSDSEPADGNRRFLRVEAEITP